MDGGDELRIVLLGKTGIGKSAVGNTILGREEFKKASSPCGETQICERVEKVINGRRIVVLDTPGIFDPNRSEEDLKNEIISSLVECAPGPHVFILVMPVDRFTQENQKTVETLVGYFTGDVLKHMVLLFTHGNDMDENTTIQDYIKKYEKSGKQTLKNLVEKCGNRVHVIDNTHWDKNNRDTNVLARLKELKLPEQAIKEIMEKMSKTQTSETPWFSVLSDENAEAEYQNKSEEEKWREYRTNEFQITQLMKSIKEILSENNNQPFKNETLEDIGQIIKKEVEKILQEIKIEGKKGDTDEVAIRKKAVERVRERMKTETLKSFSFGTLISGLLSSSAAYVAHIIRSIFNI